MTVHVYPVGAPVGSARVWVGVENRNTAPTVHFTLDGATASPTAIRPMSPVRDSSLVAHPTERRVYSGLYEFDQLAADESTHSLRVRVGNATRDCTLWSIPNRIPATGLNVMLSSCFHLTEAQSGAIASSVDELRKRCTLRLPAGSGQRGASQRAPHFSILMGDQVYLDLPTIGNLPKGRKPLADIFEKRYLKNWRGGKRFDRILGAAPYFALSDDHEFWNNYPHRSPIIQNSWTASGRKDWTAVSKAMFDGFQAANPDDPSRPIRVDLEEVSFLLLDTRYARTNDTFLPPGALATIRTWVDDLNSTNRIGAIVTGQSLYREGAGTVHGAVADYEYPDYDDFKPLVRELARTRPPLICLTGDVHWGRVVKSVSRKSNQRGNVYEVITSPSALVTSVGVDSVRRASNRIRGLFGRADRWPRHTQPEASDLNPRAFANGVVGSKTYTHSIAQGRDPRQRVRPALLRGDQISLLTFTKNAAGRITASVRYFSVDRDAGKPMLTVHLFSHSR